MLQKTYKVADLPLGSSQSMLTVLLHFMDRLGLPEDGESSLEVTQPSKNRAITSTDPGFPAIGPQLTVSEQPRPLHSQGTDHAEAMRLARAMTVKIHNHMRKKALTSYDDMSDMEILASPLVFKPDGKERARERGVREIEGNFLTFDMTKRLIDLVYEHVPQSMELGYRVITSIVLLRLAAVLSNDATRIDLLTDFPIRSVQLDENSSHIFGGVVNYVLSKYSATSQQPSLENVLEAPRVRKLGSANIFEMKSIGELEYGLPQCILTTASWCRQSGGEEAMRGAATNGEFWTFFTYKRSIERSYYAKTETFDVSHLDWILGTLIDWIENTGFCDAFEYFKTPHIFY